MYKKIAEVLYEYEMKLKFADEDFIIRVIEIISNERNLNNYINDVIVSNDYSNKDSYYDDKKYKLFINKNNEIDRIKVQDLCLSALTGVSDNEVLNYNVSVLKVILHEMDHVLLEKEINSGETNKFHDMSKLCLEDKVLTINPITLIKNVFNYMYKYSIYESNHDLVPFERRANIESLREIKRIMKELKESDIDSSKLFQTSHLYENQLKGSEKQFYRRYGVVTNSPSYDYMNKLFLSDNEKQELLSSYNENYRESFLKDSKEFSFSDRVLYGLQLSEDEYSILTRK